MSSLKSIGKNRGDEDNCKDVIQIVLFGVLQATYSPGSVCSAGILSAIQMCQEKVPQAGMQLGIFEGKKSNPQERGH